MEFLKLIPVLVLALAFARIELSTSEVVKGKVSCLDCTQDFDYSGIRVSVKCDNMKKMVVTSTEKEGSFEVDELPLNPSTSNLHNSTLNCLAKLLGGPVQLYASRENVVSKVVKANNNGYVGYTISPPLNFSTSCPQSAKCKASKNLGSSKTIDLPLPPEWGLAPSSYYIPFFPIIGIP